MSRSVCEGDIYISRGAKHAIVGDVQFALNRHVQGPKLAVDSDYGRLTEGAVLSLQLREPSLTDVIGGVVGPQELEYLKLMMDVTQQLGRSKHLGDSNWMIGLSTERMNFGGLTVDPNTGTLAAVSGSGFVLKGYEKLRGGRINCPKGVWTFHSTNDPDRGRIGNNECALLVQSFGIGGTAKWRRGPQVRAIAARNGVLPRGTVIATLRDGYYNNDHSGRSHVGIFDGWDYSGGKISGFRLFEQSNNSNIGVSTKKFIDKYDRDAVSERKSRSPHGDFTFPVYDDSGKLLGITTVISEYDRQYRYNNISIGDEYYVVYSDGKDAVRRL